MPTAPGQRLYSVSQADTVCWKETNSCAPHLNCTAGPSIPTKLSDSECSLDARQCSPAVREVCFTAESLYFTQKAPCLGVLQDCNRFGSMAVTFCGARMGDGAAYSLGIGS